MKTSYFLDWKDVKDKLPLDKFWADVKTWNVFLKVSWTNQIGIRNLQNFSLKSVAYK